jgi:hypothetical protein
MNVTAAMALKLVPERLKSQPVFLCIDDTMVAKFGKSLRIYQNFSTMPRIMVPITSTGIVLSALCFVFRYGGNSGLSIWQFPWDTVCGKRKYPS